MRPSMSTLIIAAALNLAHDYIYYLTLHIHLNNCAILTLSHEIRSYILYSVTPALPRAQEYPRNTHSDNATRRTSRPYRWARQRARDTVSAKAGWQGDQGIRTRQQRGVYRFPFLSCSSISFSRPLRRRFASTQPSTSCRSPPCDDHTWGLAENLNACIYIHARMHAAAPVKPSHGVSCHAMPCYAMPACPWCRHHPHCRPFPCTCAYERSIALIHTWRRDRGPCCCPRPCHA